MQNKSIFIEIRHDYLNIQDRFKQILAYIYH